MPRRIVIGFLLIGLLFFLTPRVQADYLGAATNISKSPSAASLFPKVATIPGTDYVFVVWVEDTGSDDLLYFSRSTDAGATWSTPFQLTLAGQIQNPYYVDVANNYAISLAVDNPYLHIVAQFRPDDSQDFEILYVRSPDLGENGLNWEFSTLTNNSTDSLFPDVAAGDGFVHVTYEDSWPGNIEVIYKRIADNGGGALDQTRRLTFSSGYSTFPKIAVSKDGETVHIVYTEEPLAGGSYLFYKRLADSGAGFYSTRQLTFGSNPALDGASFPDIAASTGSDGQYIYIVYGAFWPGNWEIMYKRLDYYGLSGGSTYTARLTYTGTQSLDSSVSFGSASNAVQITYYDYWTGNSDVMHRRFAGYGGAGFLGQRVSWGIGDSYFPTIAAAGTGAYIAWSDSTSGNYEILVKKGS